MASRRQPGSAVKRYAVDLDAPPRERWVHIVQEYRRQIPAVLRVIDEVLGTGWTKKVATAGLSLYARLGLVLHSEELRGIADTLELPFGEICVLQVAYEAFAACTSIVTPHSVEGNCPHHIRTMDWDLPVLMSMTIEVEFQRKGVTQFIATTWPGNAGILTGMRLATNGGEDGGGICDSSGYSVSVNYRRTERGNASPLKETLRNFAYGALRAWPVGYLVRAVLEQDTSYATACASLMTSRLMAPVYFTVAGALPGQGIVIARDRSGPVAGSTRELSNATTVAYGGCGGLVQTNMDDANVREFTEETDWQDICDSRMRVGVAEAVLANCDGTPTPQDLWMLCSTGPCLASDTIYTVYMCPATGEYETRSKATRAQKLAATRQLNDVVKYVKVKQKEATRRMQKQERATRQ